MFTGIIEEVGEVVTVRDAGTNRHIRIRARMAPQLRIDQSVAHNGVCLTVVAVDGDTYEVTAVQESLSKSNLGDLGPGQGVDLERSLKVGERLDGHLVQGHVDAVLECLERTDVDGSWLFTFGLPPAFRHLVVPKGSICLNGIGLTVADLQEDRFTVAVIPYTLTHTVLQQLFPGGRVNVEFDVLGKYVARMLDARIKA